MEVVVLLLESLLVGFHNYYNRLSHDDQNDLSTVPFSLFHPPLPAPSFQLLHLHPLLLDSESHQKYTHNYCYDSLHVQSVDRFIEGVLLEAGDQHKVVSFLSVDNADSAPGLQSATAAVRDGDVP